MAHGPVLVLGASGFVGRSVCAQLAKRGTTIRALTRGLPKARPLRVIPSIELVEGSPHDDEALAHAIDGVEAVVNLVGILHQTRNETFERVHVGLPRRLARACRAAGVKRLVHMSALRAGRDAPSQYLRSRGLGEEAIREEGGGLAVTVFRPSVIFGEDDRFLNLFAGLVKLLPVVPLAGANTRFQPVWVEDVARSLAACMDDARTFGQAYDLCGPRTYTLAQIVHFVAGELGRRRVVVGLPEWAAKIQASVFERLPGPVMTRDNLASMKVDSVCDCPFPAVLGFAPAAMETIVARYMAGADPRGRYAEFRRRIRR